MRLYHLTFGGLGPFRDQQQVDFRDLSSSGLFLLEGPTGSGKSTLIDALVFALYGGVAAEAGHKDRLVSHYLTPGAVPFVELVFETASGIYRVRRTPEYERPKKAGAGTVKAQASVTLTRLTSPDSLDGEVLSTRVREADAEIQRAIGLNRDQFIGTVVLPQGEFASFLRAKVADRGEILQRIFRTDLYKQLQVALDEHRKRAMAARRGADERVKVAVGEFTGAAGLPAGLPDWDGEPASADQVEAALDQVLAGLAAAEADLSGRAKLAQQRLDAARSQRDDRAHRVQLRDRRRRADHERAGLDAAEPQNREDAERVAAAERAGRVADQVSAEHGAAERVGRADLDVAEARAHAPEGCGELGELDLESRRKQTDERIGGLVDVVGIEQGLPARRLEITILRSDGLSIDQEAAQVEARVAAIPAERDGLREQREVHQSLAGQLAHLAAEIEALVERHAKAVALGDARAAAATARDAVERAALETRDAQAEQARVRGLYLDGISSVLATELSSGVPCPVCGSVEHPRPAAPGQDHVSADQVDAADAALAKADRALRRCDATLREAEVRVAGLEGVVGGRTAAELAGELAAKREERGRAEQAGRRVAELDGAVRRLDEELKAGNGLLTGLREDAAALQSRIAAAEQAVAEDSGRVEHARGGQPTVADRVSVLRAESQALAQLLVSLAELRAATDDLGRQRQALAAALKREGFATAAEASAAALPARALADLRGRIEQHGQRRLLNDAELADPALAGVDPAEQIDLESAEQALADADAGQARAAGELGAAESRSRDSERAADAVRVAQVDRARLIDQTAALVRVARLATADGSNRLLMDLATYVLQQRFVAVVDAANDHLRLMSDGKLALVAHDEVEGRARRAGLGLRVVDLRTDRERPTGTLSGGETFYTALALALGLAGVVTAEAGGVSLETLFVDEGFGSLDPETLDDVMGVLTSLREGGRSVGVVSHVDEMKNRIPERISVRRDADRGPSRLVAVS